MVLDKLGDSLRNTLSKVAKSVFVDETLVNELVRDIQRALLSSDVNVKLVLELTQKIKQRALKENPPAGLSKKEYLVNVVYEELTAFLGSEEKKIDTSKKPTKIMLVGLFGSGKTTTTGKLAKYFNTRGLKTAAIQLDVYRPAAYEQLKQTADKNDFTVFGDKDEKDPIKIYKKFEDELNKFDVVIYDTAGRDSLSKDLISELDEMNKLIAPDERFLVLSGDIGQAAQDQATAFHDTVNVTGIIITKLEGTAKGGGALSACSISKAPVVFIGVGEKINDLEPFNPKGFVGRLLGMGDIESLLDKAKLAMSEEDAEDMGKKFLKGDFNLLDLYEQMQQMKKMGSLSKLVELVPGFSQLKLPKDALETQEGNLEKWKIAMSSMTRNELEEPETISSERLDRISKGSGIAVSDIRELLKQHKQGKKMVKMFKGSSPKKMEKMMKRMGGAGNLKI